MEKKVKVSIFGITYNHVNYIEDALKGFLMQETSFAYNIFVYDDASTDGTSDILRRYADEYPDIISVYISPVNTFHDPNREKIIQELYNQYLVGEYIAWCECDDYWIDPHKIQKQVDFMEKNKDCMLTTHSFKIEDCLQKTTNTIYFKECDGYISPEDIILQPKGNLATASFVMRREIVFLDDAFPRCDVGDFPTQLRAIDKGRIYYFRDVMSVYRHMHEGSWCRDYAQHTEKAIQHKVGFVEFLEKYDAYSNYKFTSLIWKKIIIYLNEIVEAANSINQSHVMSELQISKKRLEEINRVLNWVNGTPNVSDEICQNIIKHKEIYIMGKGKYSQYVKRSLDYLGMTIRGYLVSDKEDYRDSHDVYSFDEINFDSNALVIVGINQTKEEEILEIFKEKNVRNYVCPLWFRRELIINGK